MGVDINVGGWGWASTWMGGVGWMSGSEGGWVEWGGMPMVQGVDVQCE